MRVKIDYSHCMAVNVGDRDGVPEELLHQQQKETVEALNSLRRKKDSGELGFFTLPEQDVSELLEYVDRTSADFADIVVIGIGGSSLGNRALHQALNHPITVEGKKIPRIHICDNIDPDAIGDILYRVESLHSTQFQIVTKSGSTAETLANFMIFYQRLKKEHMHHPEDNVVAITDPNSGDLLKLARQEGFRTFAVPANVGGRFSVLTPVGLLSAAYTAIDIEALLRGAREMSERCWSESIDQNPAALLAFLLTYLNDARGKRNVVFMPYSSSLKSFALWFCQLWAESLGKRGKGQTPIAQEGAADQHSQLQLYMEGPADKVILFLRVETPRCDFTMESDLSADSIDYLKGKSMNDLFLSEQLATATALVKAGRPNLTLSIDRISEENLGALIYLFEFATALAGEFWKLNAFDQPGVEEGKRLTYAMMGRKGYEQKKAELQKSQQELKRFIWP